jgi:hypothetical protein
MALGQVGMPGGHERDVGSHLLVTHPMTVAGEDVPDDANGRSRVDVEDGSHRLAPERDPPPLPPRPGRIDLPVPPEANTAGRVWAAVAGDDRSKRDVDPVDLRGSAPHRPPDLSSYADGALSGQRIVAPS